MDIALDGWPGACFPWSAFRSSLSGFHHLFFQGDTWLFLYSDTLIRLFPERFWQQVFAFLALATLGEAGLVWWLASWALRYEAPTRLRLRTLPTTRTCERFHKVAALDLPAVEPDPATRSGPQNVAGRRVLLLMSSRTYRAGVFPPSCRSCWACRWSSARKRKPHSPGRAALHVDFSDPEGAADALEAFATATPIDAVVPAEDDGTSWRPKSREGLAWSIIRPRPWQPCATRPPCERAWRRLSFPHPRDCV